MRKDDLITILSRHIGSGNGISAAELARQMQCCEREVRSAISAAREEGVAVCGKPESGYFIAKTAEELDETCQFLRNRALHSLTLESRLRKIPLVDLLGQIHLPT